MPLIAPKLDDRNFHDIVEEAKKRIALYTPEWTDHNISDPGITLIELFAWMTEMILYRMNQVPDLHYIKFMELMGITLREPVPAHVPITFWLSAPQDEPVLIPIGTEISSTKTNSQQPIIFSIDKDFVIQQAKLISLFSAKKARKNSLQEFVSHNLRALETGTDAVEIFSAVPKVDEALYFGFENDLSHHILDFDMDFDSAGGAGVDPTLPPYVWEAWQMGEWCPCDVELDTTKAMNSAGRIEIHLPQLAQNTLNEQTLYWVRVRNKEISPEEAEIYMRPYRSSPRLKQLNVATWGGTVIATHANYIQDEVLGQSDGTAGQQFQLQYTPVVSRQAETETLFVHVPGESAQAWQEVADFSESGPMDKHFTLNSVSGEVRFGPAIRQLDGTIRLYGEIPPRGATLKFKQYRAGGNQEGNVQAGVLNTMLTPLPFIARVVNRTAAVGGTAAESVESAMMRVPRLLRTRHRAVTAEDFEYLAKEANPHRVGRAKCLQTSTPDEMPLGKVKLLIIPHIPSAEEHVLTPDMLSLEANDMVQIRDYLAERCLLTTRIEIGTPQYCRVSVLVELQVKPGRDFASVEQEVLHRLYRFLNPLIGGPEGTGWPFGRDLVVADVYQCLSGVPGVDYLKRIQLFESGDLGTSEVEPVEFIAVPNHSVIASRFHQVENVS